ncbi:hypothetical protein PVK06_021694 [Gossypium arboreum]|uniref:Uncharacterized protein n=1 Tax=Gossypium arboreum TaxID=29729 RepID=A0ABR0PQP2_GOSAR|nr:hypothetical protein PVK06_021694 [Gossypium arboreum]
MKGIGVSDAWSVVTKAERHAWGVVAKAEGCGGTGPAVACTGACAGVRGAGMAPGGVYDAGGGDGGQGRGSAAVLGNGARVLSA